MDDVTTKQEKLAEAKNRANVELTERNASQEAETVPVQESKHEPVVAPKAVVKKPQLGPNELVEIMNNSAGVLIYTSKRSGNQWVFEHRGATDFMEVQELVTMRSSQPKFFKNNWIKVLDEDVVEQLRLGHFYKDTLDPEKLEDVFDLPVDEVSNLIDRVPLSDKIIILHESRKRYEQGELTNIHFVKMIEEKFKVNFEEK